MFKVILALVCLLAVSRALYPYAEQDHIINLGEPTFQTALNEFPAGILIHFYEPFCYPCRQFWPELHKSTQDLVSAQSAARVAKVECHDEVRLCNARGVSAFPTLLLHKGDNHYEYRGSRTAEALTSWIQQVVDFKYPTANTEQELFARANTVILLKDAGVNNVNDALLRVIDLVTVAVAGSDLASKLGTSRAVILTQDGQKVDITDQDNADSIVGKLNDLFFTQKKAVPNFTWENSFQLKDDQDHDFVVFCRTKSFRSDGDDAKAFQSVAKELGKDSRATFVFVNIADDLLGDTVAQLFGVTADDASTVGIISKKEKILKKYKLSGTPTADSIKKLYNDWQGDSATRYYMTANSSAYQQTGYIQELVGSDFGSVTNDEAKSVLVMFYFPWCEECVKLEPTWKALAYRVRHNPNVVIARIDLSQNDVEGHDISDFPTIIFYPAGANKKPTTYTDKRNINGLKKLLFDNISGLQSELEL